MEERDRSRSPSRRTSRVEKVVGRWLRRSRESTSRERVLEDTGSQDQRNSPLRVTVNIPFEPKLKSHGFTVSTHAPPQVLDVTQGGPADGKLVTGDQLFKINDVTVDDLSPEQSADIIRECHDSILLTILRSTVGPKSSFITPEKRAKLKSNPVKVRFAEEVVVNGHSQGNSLLFLPNVLKVYLENGQTKAFKFEPNTTVKDIVLTLKEKLSIHCIAHFSLVLEQQHSISKLFLLHEDQTIQEVVEKKETQYYRCLFRVCFLPTDFTLLLREDPVAFEYLYLQSVNDVLQERFAVEMKCNMALRLAALHVQERLVSTGQSLKTPLKAVVKEWGIESFVSHTLLRNMREKDLKKAISYHMKKILSQESKPKVVSVNQARLNYMIELSALKSYGGKAFSATMMLQDRESMVSLLVGAQYGVSQVINHKLSIMTSLTHFNCITRVELVPESERVSLVKIYLQDIKPITLLMESGAAKDLSCLVSGYCKLLVDRQICVFPWPAESKSHRISSEEGYVSHCGSDCEDSDSDVDALLAHVASTAESNRTTKNAENVRKKQKEVEENKIVTNVVEKHLEEETGLNNKEMKENDEESSWSEQPETEKKPECVIIIDEPSSETSDSFPTDSHFITSMSSDSMDALEEDEFMINCSERRPCHLPLNNMCEPSIIPKTISNQNDFSALSGMADCLPSPPEASEDDCEEQMIEKAQHQEDSPSHCPSSAQTIPEDYVFTFQQEDPRHYYNICSGVTPDSARSPLQPLSSPDQMDVPIFQPPPGFGDSSSDDEFFDAQDRFASPEEPTSATLTKDCCIESCSLFKTLNLKEIDLCFSKQKSVSGVLKKNDEQETFLTHDITTLLKRSKKRRSFMETYYTSLVSFPGQDQLDTNCENRVLVSHDSNGITCYDATCMAKGICPTVSSLTHFEGEPTELESKPVNSSKSTHKSTHNATDTDIPSKSFQRKQQLMEMEPDSMEFKSVTEIMSAVLPTIVAVRSHIDQPDQEISHSYGGDDMEEGAVGGGADSLLRSLFFDVSGGEHQGELLSGQADDQVTEEGLCQETLSKKSSSLPSPGQVSQSCTAWFQIPTILHNASSDLNSEKDSREEVEPGVDKHSTSQDILSENVNDVSFQSRHFLSQREDDRLPNETDSDETDSLCDSSFQEPSSAVSSQGFLLTPCSSSILGRLSASTLRGKIHNLPLYLSRSQEFQTTPTSSSADTSRHTEAQLSSGDFEEAEEAKEVVTFNEGASEVTKVKMVTIISEEMTEVIEELREVKTNPKPTESSFGHQLENSFQVIPSSLVVTTKTPNGPWALVGGHHSTTNIFTCHQSQPTTIQPQSLTDPNPHQKQDLNCSSVMTLGCDIAMEDVRTPLEVCQTVYASCFSGVLDSTSFDDELTVYAFSQQSKQDGSMSLLPVSPFSSPLTSFPQLLLPASPSMELSPLLSPLETPDCVLSDPHEDIIAALLTRQYPLPPMGFLCLQRDVDVLLALLTVASNALEVPEHPSDSCVNNFSENKRQLHMEARGLLAGCQRVIRVGQTEKQTLQSLSESFHSLVQLSSLCLCFSSCQRCAERHTQVRTRLVDVTKMYRDFVQAAESATNKKTYQDFGIKLLACRCTALTTSVFCLTQLFRTLTAL